MPFTICCFEAPPRKFGGLRTRDVTRLPYSSDGREKSI